MKAEEIIQCTPTHRDGNPGLVGPMSEGAKRGGARPGAGRPRKAEAEKAKQQPPISFRLPPAQLQAAKTWAALNDQSVAQWAAAVVARELEHLAGR